MRSKMRRSVIFCLILVVAVSLLAACAPSTKKTVSFPIEVTDQLGRVVKLEKIPERIISFAPSNTEILFALGLGDKVVAVTDYGDYPLEAKEKPSIGGFSTPNIEEVVAHSPDLILATSMHESKIIPHLEERGMAVLALNPRTLDEILAAIILVGTVTAKEEAASQLVARMQSRIKAVADKTDSLLEAQRLRVFYLVWHDPLMTAGLGTFHNELIQLAGGTNVARDLTGYAAIELEAVIAANPQVMIAGVTHGTDEDLTFQLIKTELRLRETEARRGNRIYGIDGNLTSRPGPRIVDALEKFAEFIHSELFK